MIIPYIILAFTQYTIYRVNMLCKFKPKQFNSFSLFSEFKQDLIMNLKFIERRNIIKIMDNQYLIGYMSTLGYEISLSNANWFQWSVTLFMLCRFDLCNFTIINPSSEGKKYSKWNAIKDNPHYCAMNRGGTWMLSVSLIRCKSEALKKLHPKSTIKCFKEVNIDKWPDLSYSFLPIDYCVRINGKPNRLFSGDIQS